MSSYDDWKTRSDVDELKPEGLMWTARDAADRERARWRNEAHRYVHHEAKRDHMGFVTACGVYVGREQYGERSDLRTELMGRPCDCPRCLAATAVTR